MSEAGVTGNPSIFASATVFQSWNGKAPASPKAFVGFVKGLVAFHDPELTLVYPHGNGVVLVQQIAASSNPKRYLKKLPATGWKSIAGSFSSEGGEHVLFDAMYSAADYADRDQREDIEAESGKPIRITLAKGEYRLDVLGTWKPDDETELMVARLVPTSEPLAKPETKATAKANATPKAQVKQAKEMKLQFVDGRFPGPLPPLDESSPPFLRYLHELETAMREVKRPVDIWNKEATAIDKGKRRFTPADAHAVVSTMLPIDLGKQPDNPDRSRVKSKPQWNQQNREFQALSDRRFVRSGLWTLILKFVGRDAKLKREWMKHVKQTDAFYRDGFVHFLKQQ